MPPLHAPTRHHPSPQSHANLHSSRKQTLGKLPADAFGMLTLPRLPLEVIEGFRSFGDLTGVISDAMDQLGIAGAVPGSTLRPTDPKARIVGQALTLKNIKVEATVAERVAGKVSGLRDIDHSRAIGYPVWSSSVSPMTGKWRIQTVGVNVPVVISGVAVQPGDLVLADEVGVCFIPFARAAEVLALAKTIDDMDNARIKLLDEGIPLPEFVKASPALK